MGLFQLFEDFCKKEYHIRDSHRERTATIANCVKPDYVKLLITFYKAMKHKIYCIQTKLIVRFFL